MSRGRLRDRIPLAPDNVLRSFRNSRLQNAALLFHVTLVLRARSKRIERLTFYTKIYHYRENLSDISHLTVRTSRGVLDFREFMRFTLSKIDLRIDLRASQKLITTLLSPAVDRFIRFGCGDVTISRLSSCNSKHRRRTPPSSRADGLFPRGFYEIIPDDSARYRRTHLVSPRK